MGARTAVTACGRTRRDAITRRGVLGKVARSARGGRKRERQERVSYFSGCVAAVAWVGDGLGLHSAAWAGGEPFPGPHAQCSANQRTSSPMARLDHNSCTQNQFLQWRPQLYCVTLLPSSGVKGQGLPNAIHAYASRPCLRPRQLCETPKA